VDLAAEYQKRTAVNHEREVAVLLDKPGSFRRLCAWQKYDDREHKKAKANQTRNAHGGNTPIEM